jgi:hypothetical protein
MKTCTVCHIEKNLADFYQRSRSPDGHEAMCKQCRLASNRAWVTNNKARHEELTRDWYQRNKEQHLANSKDWYAANRHRKLASTTAREERCRLATPIWADRAAIISVYEHARRMTQETGVQYDVDHIIPLHGKAVSGLHIPANLQVIPSAENKRKAAKFIQVDS